MGTRYEDQPPEHWAGTESLDPTPVSKQFLLVGLLGLAGIVLVALFSWLALAVQLATPPAQVAGGRVVLLRADVPSASGRPHLVGSPIVAEAQSFYLVQPAAGEILALRAVWAAPDQAGRACDVLPVTGAAPAAGVAFVARCPEEYRFGVRGEPIGAPRALDRYLVSAEGDRVVVNVSRLIEGYGQTPQPTLAPLR